MLECGKSNKVLSGKFQRQASFNTVGRRVQHFGHSEVGQGSRVAIRHVTHSLIATCNQHIYLA